MKNALIFIKLLGACVTGWFSGSSLEIRDYRPEVLSLLDSKALNVFEKEFTYPFSADETFSIQHGAQGDYFAFFKRLGEPYFVVVKSKKEATVIKVRDGVSLRVKQHADEIVAAACCVLRTLSKKDGSKTTAWYMCDLKVNEKYQGEHVPLRIVQQVGLQRFTKCPRGYGICMNPSVGQPKAARIFAAHGPLNLDVQTLNLYSLSAQEVCQHAIAIKKAYCAAGFMTSHEQLGFVNTAGAKDYNIFNKTNGTHRLWRLLHVRPSHQAGTFDENALYMLCAVEGSALDKAFRMIAGSPSSTAQIVSYGMQDIDFNFLTSDQI